MNKDRLVEFGLRGSVITATAIGTGAVGAALENKPPIQIPVHPSQTQEARMSEFNIKYGGDEAEVLAQEANQPEPAIILTPTPEKIDPNDTFKIVPLPTFPIREDATELIAQFRSENQSNFLTLDQYLETLPENFRVQFQTAANDLVLSQAHNLPINWGEADPLESIQIDIALGEVDGHTYGSANFYIAHDLESTSGETIPTGSQVIIFDNPVTSKTESYLFIDHDGVSENETEILSPIIGRLPSGLIVAIPGRFNIVDGEPVLADILTLDDQTGKVVETPVSKARPNVGNLNVRNENGDGVGTITPNDEVASLNYQRTLPGQGNIQFRPIKVGGEIAYAAVDYLDVTEIFDLDGFKGGEVASANVAEDVLTSAETMSNTEPLIPGIPFGKLDLSNQETLETLNQNSLGFEIEWRQRPDRFDAYHLVVPHELVINDLSGGLKTVDLEGPSGRIQLFVEREENSWCSSNSLFSIFIQGDNKTKRVNRSQYLDLIKQNSGKAIIILQMKVTDPNYSDFMIRNCPRVWPLINDSTNPALDPSLLISAQN